MLTDFCITCAKRKVISFKCYSPLFKGQAWLYCHVLIKSTFPETTFSICLRTCVNNCHTKKMDVYVRLVKKSFDAHNLIASKGIIQMYRVDCK